MNRSLVFVGMAAIILISVLCVLLARSNAALATSESDNRVLRSDNALQTAVITTQAFNFNRFNQIPEPRHRRESYSHVKAVVSGLKVIVAWLQLFPARIFSMQCVA